MGWGCRHKRLFVPRKDWRRNPGSGARRPGHIWMPVISLHHCIERIGSEGRATCVEACHQRQPPLCNPTIDHCRQFQSAQGTRAFKHVACTPICCAHSGVMAHAWHVVQLSITQQLMRCGALCNWVRSWGTSTDRTSSDKHTP